MLSLSSASAVAAACCTVLASHQSDTAVANQQTQSRERHVRRIPFTLRPIAERLRPDDDIVIVEWAVTDTAVWDEQPTPKELLKFAVTALSSTTAVVTVAGVSGVLALENSWIHTKFVATVDEVLTTGKEVSSRDRVSPGQAIEFSVHGGEAAVDGVVVRARDVVRYPIGRKYLVFLDQLQHENGWSLNESVPFLIENDRLLAVAPATSKLSGLTLADVPQAIRDSP